MENQNPVRGRAHDGEILEHPSGFDLEIIRLQRECKKTGGQKKQYFFHFSISIVDNMLYSKLQNSVFQVPGTTFSKKDQGPAMPSEKERAENLSWSAPDSRKQFSIFPFPDGLPGNRPSSTEK